MEPIGSNPNGGQSQYPQYPKYPPYPTERRRSRWWIPVVIICVIIFGFIAVIVGLIAAVGSSFKNKTVVIREKTVLQLKIAGTLEERSSASFFDVLLSDNNPVTYLDVLIAIKRAKDDKNIVGMYLTGGDFKAGFSKANEIRAALEDFKTSGKFIYSFIETGDERDYFLASVADSVFMPTEGLLEMNGFATTRTFLKGTLDKIGVEFYVFQFEEYKSFVEQFTRKGYSEPAKQEDRELLTNRLKTFVQAVAGTRKMDEAAVNAALARGVYTTDSLLALGFIDGLRSEGGVRDAMRDRIANGSIVLNTEKPEQPVKKGDRKDDKSDTQKSNAKDNGKSEDKSKNRAEDKSNNNENSEPLGKSEKLHLVTLAKYVDSDSYKDAGGDDKTNSNTQIALIAASGSIVSSGDSDENIVASALIKNIQKARENKKIKAIILRIDSPGGSVIASDAIWEEIVRTRAVKPVYASMSDVAASGGYYIAMPCDTIIAHPTTITGSIGLFLILPNASKLINNLGVSVDTVKSSPDAIPYDPALPLTDANKQRLYKQSETIYKRFVSRMAESRHKTFEDARAVAKGRVWTGVAARERGLVDTLGGLYTAIGIAKRRLGIAEGTRVTIKRYPEQKDSYQRVMERIFNDDKENENGVSLREELNQALRRKSEADMQEKIPFWTLIPESVRPQIQYLLKLSTMARTEQVLMVLPAIPDIR